MTLTIATIFTLATGCAEEGFMIQNGFSIDSERSVDSEETPVEFQNQGTKSEAIFENEASDLAVESKGSSSSPLSHSNAMQNLESPSDLVERLPIALAKLQTGIESVEDTPENVFVFDGDDSEVNQAYEIEREAFGDDCDKSYDDHDLITDDDDVFKELADDDDDRFAYSND